MRPKSGKYYQKPRVENKQLFRPITLILLSYHQSGPLIAVFGQSKQRGIVKRGGGSITTKTAADIACTLATGLLSPITGQIDPLHVGEVERAINIAYQYGIRLNSNEDRINRLVNDYPSHSFVIDYEEAKQIFENVRYPTESETRLEHVLQVLADEQGRKLTRYPHAQGIVAHLKPRKEEPNEQEQKSEQITQQEPASGPRSNGSGNKKSKKDISNQLGKTPTIGKKAEGSNTEDGQKQHSTH